MYYSRIRSADDYNEWAAQVQEQFAHYQRPSSIRRPGQPCPASSQAQSSLNSGTAEGQPPTAPNSSSGDSRDPLGSTMHFHSPRNQARPRVSVVGGDVPPPPQCERTTFPAGAPNSLTISRVDKTNFCSSMLPNESPPKKKKERPSNIFEGKDSFLSSSFLTPEKRPFIEDEYDMNDFEEDLDVNGGTFYDSRWFPMCFYGQMLTTLSTHRSVSNPNSPTSAMRSARKSFAGVEPNDDDAKRLTSRLTKYARDLHTVNNKEKLQLQLFDGVEQRAMNCDAEVIEMIQFVRKQNAASLELRQQLKVSRSIDIPRR